MNKRAFPHRAYNSPHNFSFCGHHRSSLSFGRTCYTLAGPNLGSSAGVSSAPWSSVSLQHAVVTDPLLTVKEIIVASRALTSAMRDSLHPCETVELRAVGNFPERFYARVGAIDRDRLKSLRRFRAECRVRSRVPPVCRAPHPSQPERSCAHR